MLSYVQSLDCRKEDAMDRDIERKIGHMFENQLIKDVPERTLMAKLVIFSQEGRDTETIKKELLHRRKLDKWLDEYGTWHKGQAPYGTDDIIEEIKKLTGQQ